MELEDNAQGLALYKDFINETAALTKNSIAVQRVNQGFWISEPANDDFEAIEFNKLLSSLSIEQRNQLAKLVCAVRAAGIHDLLVHLSDYELSFDGVKMAQNPFGTEMSYDFVCRCEGDEWPKIP